MQFIRAIINCPENLIWRVLVVSEEKTEQFHDNIIGQNTTSLFEYIYVKLPNKTIYYSMSLVESLTAG